MTMDKFEILEDKLDDMDEIKIKLSGKAGVILVSPNALSSSCETSWQTAFLCAECQKVISG